MSGQAYGSWHHSLIRKLNKMMVVAASGNTVPWSSMAFTYGCFETRASGNSKDQLTQWTHRRYLLLDCTFQITSEGWSLANGTGSKVKIPVERMKDGHKKLQLILRNDAGKR